MATDSKRDEFLKRCEELTFDGGDVDAHIAEIETIAAELDLQSYVGWIAFAGTAHDGRLNVQFNIPGNGYSSSWPQWAFDSAKDALLHGKKLWVISDGSPFGNNLLQTLIRNINA